MRTITSVPNLDMLAVDQVASSAGEIVSKSAFREGKFLPVRAVGSCVGRAWDSSLAGGERARTTSHALAFLGNPKLPPDATFKNPTTRPPF